MMPKIPKLPWAKFSNTSVERNIYVCDDNPKTKISIIIPTLNEEDDINNLLTDLENQTYKNIEVIIVDSNSDDKTVEIAKQHDKTLSLKIINDSRNGPGAARNRGAEAANGEYFIFFDADVSLPGNWIEQCLKEFKSRKLTAATCYIWPKSTSHRDRILWLFFFNWVYAITQYFFQTAMGLCIITTKKEHFKINGFNETIKLGEDCEYLRRIAKHGKYRILSKLIFVSTRRTDLEGRLTLLLQYTRAGIKQVFLNSFNTQGMTYKFGHYKKLKQNSEPEKKADS